MTGDELKGLRKRQGLSRRALASLAGLHPDTVKYWEGKPQMNMRGHAPDLLFKALGLGHLSQKHVYPAWRHLGNFRTSMRARGGVLLNIPSQGPIGPWEKCGAKTRKGTACRAKALPGKTRCRFHGGLSTGPRTDQGRRRIAEAQRKRWRAFRNVAGKS